MIELTKAQRDELIEALVEDWLSGMYADFGDYDGWMRDMLINGRVPLTEYSNEDLLQAVWDVELPIGDQYREGV